MKKIIVLPLLMLFYLAFSQENGYKLGDKVNDFSLKNIDGNMISLNTNQSAKGYIIIFTCNHCPYAKLYEDRIIALDEKYAKLGYPVIAINPNDATKEPDDSYEKMKSKSKEKGFTFPYLVDESQSTAKAFGATRTPHVYIVQKNGSDFILKYMGAIDDNPQNSADVDEKFVENTLNELQAGKSVSKNTTRAIGCTIKWK